MGFPSGPTGSRWSLSSKTRRLKSGTGDRHRRTQQEKVHAQMPSPQTSAVLVKVIGCAKERSWLDWDLHKRSFFISKARAKSKDFGSSPPSNKNIASWAHLV